MKRLLGTVGIVASLGLILVAIASASASTVAPSNDNFANATPISILPFSNVVDVSAATAEIGEPALLGAAEKTIWYSFVPSTDVILTADANGSDGSTAYLSVFRADSPGFGGLTAMGSAVAGWGSLTIPLKTGATYYIQQGDYWLNGSVTAISINLQGQSAPSGPPNDDFADATAVTSLPFTDTVSAFASATSESGEPTYCSIGSHTLWYQFVAPRDGVVVATASVNSDSYYGVLNVYLEAGSGFGGLTSEACQSYGSSTQFVVQAGATYYLQASSVYWYTPSSSDSMSVSLQYATPPGNDDFANATPITSLPFADTQDLKGATVETSEPVNSCHGTLVHTAWYAFTPTATDSYMIALGNGNIGDINVYTGSALNNLTNIACAGGYGTTRAIFTAVVGTTYYVQAGTWDLYGSVGTTLQTTPQPVVQYMTPSPGDPSTFDTVQFNSWFYDPAGIGISTWTWAFGDGTTAKDVTNPTHKYTADGDYNVTLTIGTQDGRTATQTISIPVRTHDVTILSLVAPDKGRVGKQGTITVGIGNTRYSETVQVDIYRVTQQGNVLVGSNTQTVGVLKLKKTVSYSFNYVFSADDLSLGKVTFQAVATLQGARDALPGDNTATAVPTLITR